MPMTAVCVNHPNCHNSVARYGDECEVCQERRAREQRNRWMWAGWSRDEERFEQKHHGRKDKAAK